MLRTISKLKGGKKRHNATRNDKTRHNEINIDKKDNAS